MHSINNNMLKVTPCNPEGEDEAYLMAISCSKLLRSFFEQQNNYMTNLKLI